MSATPIDRDVDAFVAERNEAVRKLDMEWARKKMPHASDDVLLIAMHKTRYESIGLPDDLRRESRAWLEQRGYSRMGQLPWPKDGKLPQ